MANRTRNTKVKKTIKRIVKPPYIPRGGYKPGERYAKGGKIKKG